MCYQEKQTYINLFIWKHYKFRELLNNKMKQDVNSRLPGNELESFNIKGKHCFRALNHIL